MSDQRELVKDAGPVQSDSGLLSGKGVAGGIGAVVGGMATLTASLGLKDLLQNNPFFALAIFSLLAAILIFGFALVGSTSISKLPVMGFALALLSFGVAAGFVAMIRGPAKVELIVSATPSLVDAKPIRFGTDEVVWGGPTHIRAGGPLMLDLTGVQAYFAQKEAQENQETLGHCVALVEALAPKLNVGPGAPATPTPPPGA
jgi:hypothetical protein